MKGECQQVEGDEDAGECFLAVTEIVFEVVAVGLEDVEGLVLDLPASPAAGGDFGNGLGGDRQIGDEAVGIGHLSFGVADLDGEPIDDEGVVAGAQRHGGEPAIDVGRALARLDDGLAVLFEFGAAEVFGDGLVRGTAVRHAACFMLPT